MRVFPPFVCFALGLSISAAAIAQNVRISTDAGVVAVEDSPTLPVLGAPMQGPSDALVTVVLFGDLRDPFTASTRATLRALRERYRNDVRIVWKFHVNTENSPDGRLVAEGALAANAQGRFWEYFERVLDITTPLGAADLERVAGELRIDVPRFRNDVTNHTYGPQIEADLRLASGLNIGDYAPVFVINGTRVVGAHPIERLIPVIDAARTAAARGPRTSAYRRGVEQPVADPEGFPTPPQGFSRVRDTTVLYRVPLEGAPVFGPADALVTIVAFEDFQCPVCVRSEPVLQEVLRRFGADVRLVFRHLPLWIHLDAIPAAEASMEAFAQGGADAFWRYHHTMFAASADPAYVSRAALERYAQQQGLDVPRFRRALDQRLHGERVRADLRLATQLGVGGTPAFFINGRVLTGFQTVEALSEAVETARTQARERVAAGTPRAQVYDVLTANAATSERFLPAEPGGTEPRYPVRSRPTAPARGPANAPVTLLLFAGMEGQSSVRRTAAVEAIAQQNPTRIRVEYRNFFVESVHPHARMAADAAMEVFAQQGFDGYIRYRNTLFSNQSALTRPDLERYAAAQRVDMNRFRASLDTRTHRAEIAVDQDAARAFGFAFEAPVVFVNGRRIGPSAPVSQLEQAVTNALNAAPNRR